MDARQSLVGGTVGGSDHSFQRLLSHSTGHVLCDVRLLRHGGNQFVIRVEIYFLDGLGSHSGTHLDGQHVVLCHFQGSRADVDRSLFLRAGEGSDGILGRIGLHVLLDPGHGRPFGAVTVESGVVDPGGAMDVAPEGDACTIGCLPHRWEHALVLCFLLCVVGDVDIELCDEHGHLQCVLLLFQCVSQIVLADVGHVVRLVSVGVDRSSCIA